MNAVKASFDRKLKDSGEKQILNISEIQRYEDGVALSRDQHPLISGDHTVNTSTNELKKLHQNEMSMMKKKMSMINQEKAEEDASDDGSDVD